MRHYWHPRDLAAVRSAIHGASVGTPTVVFVHGDPGTGKSSFVDDIRVLAEGFNVFFAAGSQGDQKPFGILAQWGVEIGPLSSGGQLTSFVMAQRLRELVDRGGSGGKVILVIDDLHWADPESSEALTWLMRRVSGDRLLLVVASRRLSPGQHPEWQSLASSLRDVARITLTGLGVIDGIAMVQERRPEIPELGARRLWEHTGGNPLYLGSLLAEQNSDTLMRPGTLPAPVEFARTIAARLDTLDDNCILLARAMAVLGPGWTRAAAVFSVARLTGSRHLIDELVDVGLVDRRGESRHLEIRLSHALIQAAVYQGSPVTQRQALHLAAAAVLTSPQAVLEHRFAAADHHDDALADELEAAGHDMYVRRSFRLAAQYLKWASELTTSSHARRRRWVDFLFTSVIAHDFAVVAPARIDVDLAGDEVGRRLVLGALAITEQDWSEAVRLLTPASALVPVDDAVLTCRIESLLAWGRINVGHPVEETRVGLQKLADLGIRDAGASPYADLASGQALSRIDDMYRSLQGLSDLATRPDAIPLEQTFVLAFRGAFELQCGLVTAAVSDLTEAQSRIEGGLLDVTDGALHAYLGYAHWFSGQWDLARLYFRLAEDVCEGRMLPIMRGWLPVLAAASGRLNDAEKLIDRATDVLESTPAREAVQALAVSRVIHLHAAGHTGAQSALWDDLSRRFPTTSLHEGTLGPLYLLHLALAALWGGHTDEAETYVEQILSASLHAPWVPAGIAWLRALLAENQGDDGAATAHIGEARTFPPDDLPLYRAHVLIDHARIAAQSGDSTSAQTSWDQALEIYTALDATAYLARLRQKNSASARLETSTKSKIDVSDRERDVLTLVLSGFSYAEIARELFITQSTVSFHLGNLYSKANVRGKHQLAALARKDPNQFGLRPTTV